jgi:hypothetical protein
MEAGQNCAVDQGQSAMPGPRMWLGNLGKYPGKAQQFTCNGVIESGITVFPFKPKCKGS